MDKDFDGLIINNPFTKEDEEDESLPLVQSLMNKKRKIIELADSELGKDPKKIKKSKENDEVIEEDEEEENEKVSDETTHDESIEDISDDKTYKSTILSSHERFLQPYWYQFDHLNEKEDDKVKDEIENQISIDIENVWQKLYEYHVNNIKKSKLRKRVPPLSIDFRTHKLVVDLVFDFLDTLLDRASDIISQYDLSENAMKAPYTIVPDILRIMCFDEDMIDKVQKKLDALYEDKEFSKYVYNKKRIDEKKNDDSNDNSNTHIEYND